LPLLIGAVVGSTGAAVGITGAIVGFATGVGSTSGQFLQAAGQRTFTFVPSFDFFLHLFLRFFLAHLQLRFFFLILNLSFLSSVHVDDRSIGAADAIPSKLAMAMAKMLYEILMFRFLFLLFLCVCALRIGTFSFFFGRRNGRGDSNWDECQDTFWMYFLNDISLVGF